MENLLTRRVFAGASAAAGLSVAAIAMAASPVAHDDAQLIALGTRLMPAAALSRVLGQAADQAYEGYEPTPIPDALFWRRSDVPAVWNASPWLNLDGVGDDQTERYTYAREDIRPKLVQRLERLRATRGSRSEDVDRLREIIAAFDAWIAAEGVAYAACGFTAATEASHRQYAVVDDLLKQIAAIPALTPEGVCVKARAAWAASHRCIALLEESGLAQLSTRGDLGPGELEELLTMSMMIDVHKIEAGIVGFERDAA